MTAHLLESPLLFFVFRVLPIFVIILGFQFIVKLLLQAIKCPDLRIPLIIACIISVFLVTFSAYALYKMPAQLHSYVERRKAENWEAYMSTMKSTVSPENNIIELEVDGITYQCISGSETDIEAGDRFIYKTDDGNLCIAEADHVQEHRVYFDPGGHDPEWEFYAGIKIEDVWLIVSPTDK